MITEDREFEVIGGTSLTKHDGLRKDDADGGCVKIFSADDAATSCIREAPGA
jgi:hypothetical protein